MPPIGSPNCPYCDSEIEPQSPVPFGTTTCESCDKDLFYLTVNSTRVYFKRSEARLVRFMLDGLAEHQRIPSELGLDGMDLFELVREFLLELQSEM